MIVKNQTMRSRLISLGAQPAQLVISPSGADERRFQGATPASMPPRFLAVGRFVAKGPLDTLEAFALLQGLTDHADACSLVMVGDGPLLPSCRTGLTSWDLSILFSSQVFFRRMQWCRR